MPTLATWYLATNLPAPGSTRAVESEHPAADLAEVVRIYGLRMWVEQSYKQVKYALGFSDYQVRSDLAIRRHWQLVCCAFSFCWWALAQCGAGALELDELGAPPRVSVENAAELSEAPKPGARGKKEQNSPSEIVARGFEGGEGLAGALCNAYALLECVLRQAPAAKVKSAA